MKEELKKTIQDIKKEFGKESLVSLTGESKKVEVIPTGCFSIDDILGVGGIPKGRIIEVYGMESSGKTTLALHITAECQKAGGNVGYIDAEHALDPLYAKNIGVNIEELLLSQPDSGEQALQILQRFVESGNIDLVVVDSVASLVPQAEIDAEMGALKIGLQARLMSSALRKLVGIVNKNNVTIIFINQIRMKIGVYGNPETTPGGLALKFYSSVRIELRKKGTIKYREEPIGAKVKVKIAKSKISAPFKTTEVEIIFNKGIDKLNDLVGLAVKNEIIEKKGAWFYYKDKTWNGIKKVTKAVEDDKELQEELTKLLRKDKSVDN